MPRWVKALLAIAVMAEVSGVVIFGGAVTSGGFWLTLPASGSGTPANPPWIEPYHKGGIDLGTGLYVRNDEDLVVEGGDLPLVLQRTYRSRDQVSRAFGVGATHNGEWYLRGDGERFQWAELVLDDGARIRYERTSPGSSSLNAMFQHTATASGFYGSRLGWTGLNWALRWSDGSVAIFRACGSTARDLCSLVELRSASGLAIEYVRDRKTHSLNTIRSGATAISLDYDAAGRIARARGGKGQEVAYEYDVAGHLTRVRESTGVARTYTYDSRGAMLSIDEPRWHLENVYDADGRCVQQTTTWPDGESTRFDVAYKLRDGVVAETTTSWDDGPETVYHFNRFHYPESKEIDRDGPAPVVIDYHRNAFSNISTRLTVRCYDSNGGLLHEAEGWYEGDDAADAFAAATCRP